MRSPYAMYNEVEPFSARDAKECKNFKTYRELKKNMGLLIKDSYNGIVCVYRERRGEWGEWFEHWAIRNNKPTIIKEGWM